MYLYNTYTIRYKRSINIHVRTCTLTQGHTNKHFTHTRTQYYNNILDGKFHIYVTKEC